MKVLLDTHILLWLETAPELLSDHARSLLMNTKDELLFSVVSIWETAIKYGLRREDFGYEPRTLRRALLRSGLRELEINAEHVIAVAGLPPLHRDPFDRLLIAQAGVEGATLITADPKIAQYIGPTQLV